MQCSSIEKLNIAIGYYRKVTIFHLLPDRQALFEVITNNLGVAEPIIIIRYKDVNYKCHDPQLTIILSQKNRILATDLARKAIKSWLLIDLAHRESKAKREFDLARKEINFM